MDRVTNDYFMRARAALVLFQMYCTDKGKLIVRWGRKAVSLIPRQERDRQAPEGNQRDLKEMFRCFRHVSPGHCFCR
jgi:hypothetical protein